MVDLAEKGPMGLNGLRASEIARRLEAGSVTSEALVRDCLARIEAREGDVLAWDHLDPKQAIAQARALDATPRRSLLHGVPVGIKDIFDTKDMPTGHGFAPYAGASSRGESNCVAALRAAGLVIMGKTVTTEFACSVPRRTRNPHDPTRTPGVSSSGSAAAVADFMIPLANGTQTGGSIIAPSACCGVYGYKASLDGIDRGGFRHCKTSIDTIGLFARSIDDLILFRSVQTGKPSAQSIERSRSVRIAVVLADKRDTLEPAMAAALDSAAQLLGAAGARVTEVALPKLFKEIIPDFAIVNGWEATQTLHEEIRDHLDAFNTHNRQRVEFVRGLTRDDYEAAGGRLNAARAQMNALFTGHDVFLSPSQTGEAPVGLDTVHSSTFARLWTQMYTPSVNLPLFNGPNNMPLGLQIIGPKGSDDDTLAFAKWVDERLRAALA